MPSLFVIQGRDQGTRFELDEAKTAIGRVSENGVQLHDTEVSRQHAEITVDGDVIALKDLNSSNGTYVNGNAKREAVLRTGDQIQMGRTLMLFTASNDDLGASDSQVDIIAARADGDGSRILHVMRQSEGSELLGPPLGPNSTESPWQAQARSNLQIMYRTALAVSQTLDIDQLLSRIMDMIFEWVDADRGCIMLKDEVTGKLEARVRRHRRGLNDSQTSEQSEARPDSQTSRIAISKTILDYVVDNGEGVLTSNAREDDRWNPAQSIVKMGVREAICVPMQGRYDVVGVIYIDTSITPQEMLREGANNKFGQEHLKLMIAIAHQAALAVEDTSFYQAMVQAERLAAVGQTISMLSHHIKNILQGVRGGSYLIDLGMKDHAKAVAESEEGEEPIDGEEVTRAVQTMRKGWNIVEKNQERISGLVMDMLTYSKEREPEPEEANLNSVVEDVVEMMRTRAADAGVKIDWQPADDMPTMMFDPEALHRAILNVVSNAIDACEAGNEEDRTVTVRTQAEPAANRAAVVVSDTGIGIEKEDFEKIFTVFVSKKGGRGTGLGLPVTQKILSEHGGAVNVTSELGSGSTFTLELPIKATAKPGPAKEDAPEDIGPAPNTLVGDPMESLSDSSSG